MVNRRKNRLITILDQYLKGKLVTHVTMKYWEELKEMITNED